MSDPTEQNSTTEEANHEQASPTEPATKDAVNDVAKATNEGSTETDEQAGGGEENTKQDLKRKREDEDADDQGAHQDGGDESEDGENADKEESYNERQDREEQRRRKEVGKERDWRERRDSDRQRNQHKRKISEEERKALAEQRRALKAENIKADYSKQEISTDPKEIRKQVEFYFSDSNLPTDKFLLEQTGGIENKPVPISTLHNFKRMRRFQPYESVVEALRDSDFLEVTEDGGVRRKTPLSKEFSSDYRSNVSRLENNVLARTVYVKGFGDEGPTTQLDIEAFFEKHGPINAVRLRRDFKTSRFKGSAFAEFASEDKTRAFLDLKEKPKFNDRELLVMSKDEYEKKEHQKRQLRMEEERMGKRRRHT